MKKWLSFLLALCMLLSLTACGNESGGPSGNPSEPKSPTDVEVELTEPVTITFWHGIVQSLPFLIVIVPFAVLFGVVALEAGMDVAQVMGFSVLVEWLNLLMRRKAREHHVPGAGEF